MTRDELNRRLTEQGVKNVDLATLLEISEDKVSKARSAKGVRRWSAEEMAKIVAFLDRGGDISREPDLPIQAVETSYVAIEVLPTFGGMGGGGSGEGDRTFSLIPRALVVDTLRGKPDDFLIINVRGDSMEPDFYHDDQLLIDRRDVSPAQPGPFALWDGEWGEYVLKNVERSRSGEVRIFSTNPKYRDETVSSENTKIIGRPVWFGRKV